VPAWYTEQVRSIACNSPHSPSFSRSKLTKDYDTYGALVSELSVSLNAADFDDTTTPFEFYDPPGALRISAAVGPVLGGTPIVISGTNLTGGTDRRCRFTPVMPVIPSLEIQLSASRPSVEVFATLVEALRLRCVTPPLPKSVARITLEVSLNGQQYTHEGMYFDLTNQDSSPTAVI